jgi:hypothetical protein
MIIAKGLCAPRRWMAWPVLLLFLALAQTFCARGKDWKSEEFNCALTVPDDWHQGSAPDQHAKVLFQSADNNKIVFVMVYSDPKLEVLNDEFVRGVKEGLTAQGGKVVRERRFEIAGLPACELVGEFNANGRKMYCKIRAVIADHMAYAAQGMSATASIDGDAQVQQALESFHFLHAPEKPSILSVDRKSAAYQIGYFVGRWGIFIAAFAAVVVLGVVFLIIKLATKNRPPPMPPGS